MHDRLGIYCCAWPSEINSGFAHNCKRQYTEYCTPPVLLNRGGQITNLRVHGWRGNRIPASPRLQASVSRCFLLFDNDLHARSLFCISRLRDCAVVAYFLVEDVPATVNSLDNLMRLIAERMPNV